MANNKATAEGSSQLSDELDGIVQKLVKQASGSNNSITEDDIQLAIAEVDVDDDELSDMYDVIRAKGVDIANAEDGGSAMGDADDLDDRPAPRARSCAPPPPRARPASARPGRARAARTARPSC